MAARTVELPYGPGDVVAGKYEIERVLGVGGMGAVYAVHHKGLGDRRALKLMLPTNSVDSSVRERFVREARASARLKGEHAPRVHDVGVLEGDVPYIEMELLDGEDLKQIIAREGPQPVPRALEWLMQACDALTEAHGVGIVHRDIKPANLFLTKRPDGSELVKVLDFGIAKVIEPNQDQALTTTKAVIGSPLYMSPEHMRRVSLADARSDLWGLGVVLFEMLTGTVPFHSESFSALVLAVNQDPAPVPSSLRPGLPPAIDRLILKCLQKEPKRRYQTAKDLRDAVERIQSGEDLDVPAPDSSAQPPVAALGTTTQATTSRTGERARSPVPLVIGGVGLAGAAAFAFWLTRSPPPQPSPTALVSAARPTVTVTAAPQPPEPKVVPEQPPPEPMSSAAMPNATAPPTAPPTSTATPSGTARPSRSHSGEPKPKPTTGFSGVD